MDKIIYAQHDQESLLKAAGTLTQLIETEQHIKQAASSAVSEKMIRENKPDKNHFGVHLIAMGSGEKYSFNKNGDFWNRSGLIKNHDTFVKFGHFFREH